MKQQNRTLTWFFFFFFFPCRSSTRRQERKRPAALCITGCLRLWRRSMLKSSLSCRARYTLHVLFTFTYLHFMMNTCLIFEHPNIYQWFPPQHFCIIQIWNKPVSLLCGLKVKFLYTRLYSAAQRKDTLVTSCSFLHSAHSLFCIFQSHTEEREELKLSAASLFKELWIFCTLKTLC